jgi:phosphoribosylanthranilate isomerase
MMTAVPPANGRPRLKVCCIASVAEAKLAIQHGAHAIGLVSTMPSGPGVIPDDRIAEIAHSIPTRVSTFLLTSARRVDDIVEQQRRFEVDTLQLCDALPPNHLRELRSLLPGVSIVQVVHVAGKSAIDEARVAARAADALLLDSGNPSNTVKELGGTGRTHDWSLSRTIRDEVEIPVWLAGGLTPENVAEAVQTVRPFGVDVCSGLRVDGRLDEHRLVRFIQNLKTGSVSGAS